jgi:hypothetical protein
MYSINSSPVYGLVIGKYTVKGNSNKKKNPLKKHPPTGELSQF